MEILRIPTEIDDQIEILALRGFAHSLGLPKVYVKGSPAAFRIDRDRVVLVYHQNQYDAIRNAQVKVKAILAGKEPFESSEPAPDHPAIVRGGKLCEVMAPEIDLGNPAANRLSPMALTAILKQLRSEQSLIRKDLTSDILQVLSKEFIIPAPEGDRLSMTITARKTVIVPGKGPKVTPKGTPREKYKNIRHKESRKEEISGTRFTPTQYDVVRALLAMAGERLKILREKSRADRGEILDVI